MIFQTFIYQIIWNKITRFSQKSKVQFFMDTLYLLSEDKYDNKNQNISKINRKILMLVLDGIYNKLCAMCVNE